MKVGHFQCECQPGGYDANIAKVIKGLEFADAEKVRIMNFPSRSSPATSRRPRSFRNTVGRLTGRR